MLVSIRSGFIPDETGNKLNWELPNCLKHAQKFRLQPDSDSLATCQGWVTVFLFVFLWAVAACACLVRRKPTFAQAPSPVLGPAENFLKFSPLEMIFWRFSLQVPQGSNAFPHFFFGVQSCWVLAQHFASAGSEALCLWPVSRMERHLRSLEGPKLQRAL